MLRAAVRFVYFHRPPFFLITKMHSSSAYSKKKHFLKIQTTLELGTEQALTPDWSLHHLTIQQATWFIYIYGLNTMNDATAKQTKRSPWRPELQTQPSLTSQVTNTDLDESTTLEKLVQCSRSLSVQNLMMPGIYSAISEVSTAGFFSQYCSNLCLAYSL